MSDSSDLNQVLQQLNIECDHAAYGFASQSHSTGIALSNVEAFIKETEGVTIVARTEHLETNGVPYEGPFAKITLAVSTSLKLVGLTAALATALADAGLPANVIAGYHHDHIFVPHERRWEAIDTILRLKSQFAAQ